MPNITLLEYDERSHGISVVVKRPDGSRRGVSVPIHRIACESELLGYTDVIDCLDEIVHRSVTKSEKAVEYGENVWTESYAVLGFLEQAREDEAKRALDGQAAVAEFTSARAEGDTARQLEALRERRRCNTLDKRTPRERSDEAVVAALAELSGSECPVSESVLAQCQQRARDALLAPDPDCAPSLERKTPMTCDPETPHCVEDSSCGKVREFDAEDRRKCAEVLAEHLPDIEARRAAFCHSLTGRNIDPFAEDYEEWATDPESKAIARIRRQARSQEDQ